jgi:hypothetical protein
MTSATIPEVAPFESCLVCFRGDVPTGVAFEGEAEYLTASLVVLGIPEDQASALVKLQAHDEYGCDVGFVPTCDMLGRYRVCTSCAGPSPFEVCDLRNGMIMLYHQRNATFKDGSESL